MDTDTRNQLLADIASSYFIEKKTQAEIAQVYGYSRSAISRILSEAEELGIIEINIKYPLLRDTEMERRLQEKFPLKSAYVIKSGSTDYSRNISLVGRLGANRIQEDLIDNRIVGIGWGTSLFELVNALPILQRKNIQVIQVIGATGGKSDTKVDGPDLAALLASKLNAQHQFLHSPLFLDSENACNSLKSQKQIKSTLELGYQSNIVLLGIGTIDADPVYSSLFRSGFIDKQEVEAIKNQGGVANFCGVILDKNGNVLKNELNRRTMAVDLERLRFNGCKLIGIAAGSNKSQAIQAVLQGSWLDVLFTDSLTAKQVLKLQSVEV
jgi:deoxyribonucleoside regulator